MSSRIAILMIAGVLLFGSPAIATDAPMEPSPRPTGVIERAAFTTAVMEREPLDTVTRLSNDNVQVIYFTEVLEAEGDSVVHRWEWNGTVMAEISFDVRGPRWRVHSSKNLDPRWLGEWTVVTLDSAGNELRRDTFFYAATSEVDAALPASPAP